MFARFWKDRVLPPLLEVACSRPALREHRRWVVEGAKGVTVEFGCGRGSSAAHFGREAYSIRPVCGVESSRSPLERARVRFAERRVPFRPIASSLDALPFESGSVDTVVMCFVMCSVESPTLMPREAARILRPDGALRFAEHGMSPASTPARLQHMLTPVWSRVAGGCHLDRDVVGEFRRGGFDILELKTESPPGDPLTHVYRGVARAHSASGEGAGPNSRPDSDPDQ